MNLRKNTKNFTYNISLSVFSVFFAILCIEVGIRVFLYFKSCHSLEAVMKCLPELKPGQEASLRDIICPSKYPDIIYELRLNINADFMHIPIATNSQGWRSRRDYTAEKPANTVRIVTLGDSHMFGWGVLEEQRYTRVLEDKLNASFPQKQWEVINTACPGYNTFMEVETLKQRALRYSPDIVVIEYIGNDLDLPSFIMDTSAPFNFKHLFLADFVRGKIGVLNEKFALKESPTWVDARGRSYVGADCLDLVPDKYRYMVGWKGYETAMSKLKKIQREYGLDVVVLVSHLWPKYAPEKIVALCEKLKFHVIISPLKLEPALILREDDQHPSILGHRVIADTLFDFLNREGIIRKRL